MFGAVKTKWKEKHSKNEGPRIENDEDRLKGFLNHELSDLEKLLSEEAELKQMAQEKRQEISKAVEHLERKMSLFNEELEKMRVQFKELLENKEVEKERIETELTAGVGELEQIGEESRTKVEQTELELRLQSKEEENNLLKKQITELEEQFWVEREKKDQEIQELRNRLEEISGGKESV